MRNFCRTGITPCREPEAQNRLSELEDEGNLDEEGEAFRDFIERLSDHGLFDSPVDAAAFLHHYWSFDWTEHSGNFSIAEVRDASMLLGNGKGMAS